MLGSNAQHSRPERHVSQWIREEKRDFRPVPVLFGGLRPVEVRGPEQLHLQPVGNDRPRERAFNLVFPQISFAGVLMSSKLTTGYMVYTAWRGCGEFDEVVLPPRSVEMPSARLPRPR